MIARGDFELKPDVHRADVCSVKLLLIALVSVATLFGAGAPALAQDSAYPPRLIVVTVSDSSVEAGAPFSVLVEGCDVGQVVDFAIEGLTAQVQCVEPEMEQAALVLRSAPGRAEAELIAPNRPGEYVGNVRLASSGGSLTLDFDLAVVEATATFVPSAASGPPVGSGSAFSSALWMLLTFILGLALASGFWVVAQRRD